MSQLSGSIQIWTSWTRLIYHHSWMAASWLFFRFNSAWIYNADIHRALFLFLLISAATLKSLLLTCGMYPWKKRRIEVPQLLPATSGGDACFEQSCSHLVADRWWYRQQFDENKMIYQCNFLIGAEHWLTLSKALLIIPMCADEPCILYEVRTERLIPAFPILPTL